MSCAIRVEGVHKTFVKQRSLRELVARPFAPAERIPALRGVDLQIERGEIFGLLGPNGAGKTTLLKILACLVLPDAGRVTVEGIDTADEREVKSRIGLVHADERSFYWRLSARENLRFFARLYEVPGPRIDARIGELLHKVEMVDAADRPFSGYSSGMKQRIAIARALLHDPPILLMDEPTRSLDPTASLALRELIAEELKRRQGKTILLATHNLHEAAALSDRAAILVSGRVRRLGTVAELRRWDLRDTCYRLELERSAGPLPGPFRVERDATTDGVRSIDVVLDPGAELNAVFGALDRAGALIRSCERLEPDLEQAFAQTVRDGEA